MDKIVLIRRVLAQAPTRPSDWASSPEEPPKLQDLGFIFSRALTGVFALAGLAAFSYLLIGGFKYLTSGGDEKAVTAAKATLTTAVVGLIIVVASFILLNTLSSILGGTSYFGSPGSPGSFLQFEIPGP